MEKIGAHCAESTCKQLDFLPFTCAFCKKTFCLDHRSQRAHACPVSISRELPECPLCHQVIHLKATDDVNERMDAHITAGCPKEKEARPTRTVPCSFAGCHVLEVVPFHCDECHSVFCLKHRAYSDHKCPKYGHAPSPSSAKNPTAESRLLRIQRFLQEKMQSSATARKVAAMKAQQAAIGPKGVPPERKVYLDVVFPLDSGLQKMMYFDSKVTIGKLLDQATDLVGFVNKNNDPTAERLRVISLQSGQPLAMMKTIAECLQSGDAILIESLPPEGLPKLH